MSDSEGSGGVEKEVSIVKSVVGASPSAPAALSFVPVTAPTWALWVMSLITLITGTFNTITQKWMNKQNLPTCADLSNPDCEARYFESPFLQTEFMWIGELLCMPIWLIDVWISKSKGVNPPTDLPTSAESYAKPHCPFYWWVLPTIVDYCASTLINYAFVIGQASTIQMFRNFNVAITALISLVYLHMALRRQHWVGVTLICVGLIITGVYAVFNPDEDTNVDPSMAFLGVIMSLVGTALTGFQLVFQESLFRKYFANPFEGVGWMGLFGLVIGIVILVIVEFTGIEDVSGSLYQIANSGTLVAAISTYIVCVVFFNGCGISVAKLGSAVMLSIIFASRSVTVYLAELALQWNTFMVLNFSGLVVVTVGALMYNAILFPRSWAPKFTEWMATPVMCTGCCRYFICGIKLTNPDDPKGLAYDDAKVEAELETGRAASEQELEV